MYSLSNSPLSITKRERVNSCHQIKETCQIIHGQDDSGRKTVNQYTFIKKLGQGSFGKVKLAIKNDSKECFAIKIFRKSFLRKKKEFIKGPSGVQIKDGLQDVLKEIAIMKKLNHKNVIKLYEVIDDPNKDILYMILDYCEGGQLIEWDEDLEKFVFLKDFPFEYLSENFLRKIFREIIKGLYYLHNNNIIHRDLKPQNILFDENNIAKIGDFGVSSMIQQTESDKMETTAGTYHFMAPEVSKPHNGKGYSGKLADIWSLGICFYAFVYRDVPFKSDDLLDLMEIIDEKEVVFPEIPIISQELKNLILGILKKEPLERMTLNNIIENEWININSTPLNKEITEDIVEITESDIKNAVISLHTIVFLKKLAKNLRKRSISRSNLNQSEGNSPDHTPLKIYKKSKYSTLKIPMKSPLLKEKSPHISPFLIKESPFLKKESPKQKDTPKSRSPKSKASAEYTPNNGQTRGRYIFEQINK